MQVVSPSTNFAVTRLGVIMSPQANEPHEAGGATILAWVTHACFSIATLR